MKATEKSFLTTLNNNDIENEMTERHYFPKEPDLLSRISSSRRENVHQSKIVNLKPNRFCLSCMKMSHATPYS